jgi:FkbM family methyltransferase
MGILKRLGGRRRLLANPVSRAIARRIVRMHLAGIEHVAESFRGVFGFSGYGLEADYELGPGDTIGEIIYWRGLREFEPQTVPQFIELARKSRYILDIGANSGLYSVLACAANPSARVIAWEPIRALAEKVRRNISINNFGSRCEVRQCAVSSAEGEADFYISDDSTMSSLSSSNASLHGHNTTSVKVSLECLDRALPGDFPVDLIKIDVEGYEFEALAGGRAILDRWRPKIIFECLPNSNSDQIEALLRGIGYTIYSVTPAGLTKLDRLPHPEQVPAGEYNYLATFPETAVAQG